MANTETHRWVVTSGKSWLAGTPFYSTTVTRKDSMPLVVKVIVLKSELVLLAMTRTTVTRATLWLDLVREVIQKAHNLVETRHAKEVQIMDTRVSKLWGTYWCNKTTLCCVKSVNHAYFTLEISYSDKTVQANGREKDRYPQISYTSIYKDI